MLSKKTKYALKALVVLAKRYETGWPMRISQIAQEENIPHKFLEAILLELRKQGILGSKLGINGGYYLLKPPEQVMLSSVIRLTDGPIALTSCVSINFYERCAECNDEATCGVRDAMLDARNAILGVLANTSLADIVNRENKLMKKNFVKAKNKKQRV